mmetsp:Transcript_42884/g.121225  ORF Transcript_42884/g.121225 Transcript_42884/m.121225 type:complete len:246 (+) Transcript_42884:3-740(+)
MLTNFVAAGDEAGVRRVLERDPGAVNELGLDGTSPLCAAAMWDNEALLRLLLEAMASPNVRNDSGPRWTPLHAAALQENGKCCMLLLQFRARPEERDAEGVTPCDYASCSEAVWPLFAERGARRVAKAELVQKGVLRKASSRLEEELLAKEPQQGAMAAADAAAAARRGLVTEYSRPGSAYVVAREFPPRPGSVGGVRPMSGARRTGSRAGSRPIDILQEEDEEEKADEKRDLMTASTSLRSLGL